MQIADVSLFASEPECRLIDTDRPVGQALCTTSIPNGTPSPGNQVPVLLGALGSIVLGTAAITAVVAYRIGYRRACNDMSIRRPAGIIRRVDNYRKDDRWAPSGNRTIGIGVSPNLGTAERDPFPAP